MNWVYLIEHEDEDRCGACSYDWPVAKTTQVGVNGNGSEPVLEYPTEWKRDKTDILCQKILV